MREIIGKNALITGASSGIGYALVEYLAERGVNLILTARRDLEILREKCLEIAKGNGYDISVHFLSADMSNEESVIDLTIRVAEIIGDKGLDLLIPQAGIFGPLETIEKMDMAYYDLMQTINVRSPLLLCQKLLPLMRKSDAAAVIFVSSGAGKWVFPGRANYCVSKHAVAVIAEALFEEIRDDSIHVSTIFPGFVNTPMANERPELVPEQMIQTVDVCESVELCWRIGSSANISEIVIRTQVDCRRKSETKIN